MVQFKSNIVIKVPIILKRCPCFHVIFNVKSKKVLCCNNLLCVDFRDRIGGRHITGYRRLYITVHRGYVKSRTAHDLIDYNKYGDIQFQ